MKSQASLCAFGLMLSAMAAHAQAVYKCVQADGRMAYQQEKCAEAYRACVRDEQALKRASDLATQTGARLRGNDKGRESHCEMFAATLRTDTVKR